MAEFECRLKQYRLLKNLTQEQLAALVGVPEAGGGHLPRSRGAD